MFSLPLFFFLFFFSSYILYKLARFFPPASPNRVTREGSVSTSALGRLCGTRVRERERKGGKQSDNVIQKDEGGVIWPEVVPQWWHTHRERGNYDVYHLTSRRKTKKKTTTSVYQKLLQDTCVETCNHQSHNFPLPSVVGQLMEVWGTHTLTAVKLVSSTFTLGNNIWKRDMAGKEVNTCTIISQGSEHVYHHHQSRKWTCVPSSSVQEVNTCTIISPGCFWLFILAEVPQIRQQREVLIQERARQSRVCLSEAFVVWVLITSNEEQFQCNSILIICCT